MNLRNIFRMADSTPFRDEPLNVHWYNKDLYDNEYKVGVIDHSFGGWLARPFWNEDEQEFKTEEEARAWLLAMYKMGGANDHYNHKRKRPAAK